jgi:hypothetical protein
MASRCDKVGEDAADVLAGVAEADDSETNRLIDKAMESAMGTSPDFLNVAHLMDGRKQFRIGGWVKSMTCGAVSFSSGRIYDYFMINPPFRNNYPISSNFQA